MHAYLFTGGSADERSTSVQQLLSSSNIADIDRILLEPDEGGAIPIESVRDFVKQLLLTPRQSPKTAGIIVHAEILTTQSQNALLKTLEEPPPHCLIILQADHPSSILTTILSRCQHIPLLSEAETHTKGAGIPDVEALLALPVGKRLAYIDTISGTREEAAVWIRDAIRMLHRQIVERHDQEKTVQVARTSMIRALMVAQRKLSLNISAKNVLDAVVLGFDGTHRSLLFE